MKKTLMILAAASPIAAQQWTDCSLDASLCTGILCCGTASYVKEVGFGNVAVKSSAASKTVCGVNGDVTILEKLNLQAIPSGGNNAIYPDGTAVNAIAEWAFKCNSSKAVNLIATASVLLSSIIFYWLKLFTNHRNFVLQSEQS